MICELYTIGIYGNTRQSVPHFRLQYTLFVLYFQELCTVHRDTVISQSVRSPTFWPEDINRLLIQTYTFFICFIFCSSLKWISVISHQSNICQSHLRIRLDSVILESVWMIRILLCLQVYFCCSKWRISSISICDNERIPWLVFFHTIILMAGSYNVSFKIYADGKYL